MSPGDRETLYDKEIAPKLAELAKLCEDSGLSFAASVEWEPGHTGETMTLQAERGIKMNLAAWAIRCHGNVDALITQILKHGNEHGHNSIYLSVLNRKQ